jgi:hypothetical protein
MQRQQVVRVVAERLEAVGQFQARPELLTQRVDRLFDMGPVDLVDALERLGPRVRCRLLVGLRAVVVGDGCVRTWGAHWLILSSCVIPLPVAILGAGPCRVRGE